MSDHTTDRGPGDSMVASDMAGDSTNDRAFETTLRQRSLRANEKCEAEQGYEQWQLRVDGPRHTVYPSSRDLITRILTRDIPSAHARR